MSRSLTDPPAVDTDPTPPHGLPRPSVRDLRGPGPSPLAALGRAVVGCALWTVQYGLVVWAVLGWRLVAWSFRVFGWALVLVLLPIVGWLALWIVARGRRRDRQHEELVSAIRGSSSRSIWRPWALGWVMGREEVKSDG